VPWRYGRRRAKFTDAAVEFFARLPPGRTGAAQEADGDGTGAGKAGRMIGGLQASQFPL